MAYWPHCRKLRALHAVGEDLLEQPQVRHDREAHVDEIAGRVGEGAQLLEAFAPRAPPQLVDDHHADAAAARVRVDRERPHFGHLRAEWRELGAADRPCGRAIATTNRPARTVSSPSVRGRRCPSSRFAGDDRVQLFRVGRRPPSAT